MRMLSESKVLSFLFLVLFKGMGEGGESKWLQLQVTNLEGLSLISVGGQFSILVVRNLWCEEVGQKNFDPSWRFWHWWVLSSLEEIRTLRKKCLFAFQSWCWELVVGNQWGEGQEALFYYILLFEGAVIVGGWGLVWWYRNSDSYFRSWCYSRKWGCGVSFNLQKKNPTPKP